MVELITVAITCFLVGSLFGWLVGHTAGFTEGIEHERQSAIKGSQPRDVV